MTPGSRGQKTWQACNSIAVIKIFYSDRQRLFPVHLRCCMLHLQQVACPVYVACFAFIFVSFKSQLRKTWGLFGSFDFKCGVCRLWESYREICLFCAVTHIGNPENEISYSVKLTVSRKEWVYNNIHYQLFLQYLVSLQLMWL